MSAEQPKISSKCMIQQRALAHANVPVTDNEPRSRSHCRNKRCRLLEIQYLDRAVEPLVVMWRFPRCGTLTTWSMSLSGCGDRFSNSLSDAENSRVP